MRVPRVLRLLKGAWREQPLSFQMHRWCVFGPAGRWWEETVKETAAPAPPQLDDGLSCSAEEDQALKEALSLDDVCVTVHCCTCVSRGPLASQARWLHDPLACQARWLYVCCVCVRHGPRGASQTVRGQRASSDRDPAGVDPGRATQNRVCERGTHFTSRA